MESYFGKYNLKVCIESKIGGRKENQDSYLISDTPLGLLIIVCDGMGGGPAGKTASSYASQAIMDYIKSSNANSDVTKELIHAVESANDKLIDMMNDNPSLRGMGTTCVCAIIRDNSLTVAHVGDSRCYVTRNGEAVFRTQDHSHVGELVRRGTLTEEDARKSRYSNVITRAVGISALVDVEMDCFQLHSGDTVALMTDGIWGALPEAELIANIADDEDCGELTVALATFVDNIGKQLGGGHDNLTLALVQIPNNSLENKEKIYHKPPTLTVNDKIGALTSKKSQKKKTKIKETNNPDNLTPNKQEIIITENKNHSRWFWILGAIVLISIAVNLFLFLKEKNNGRVKEELVKNVISCNIHQKAKPSETNLQKPIIEDENSEYSISKNLNSIETSYDGRINQCIGFLDSIYGYTPAKTQSRNQVMEIRAFYYDQTEKYLLLAAEDHSNIHISSLLHEIASDLKNNKKIIVEGIDKRQNKTTRESQEVIESFKNRLETAKRN